MNHAAITIPAGTAPAVVQRYELYLPVHKGLRAFMCEALVNVGRMDSSDARDSAEVLAQVRGLLLMCKVHLKHENHFVHGAMEARRPGASQQTAHDHSDHERAFAELEQRVRDIEAADERQRAARVTTLYYQLALFVADNLTHMHVEETANMQVLWECYSDEELLDLEKRLVAAIPPEQNAVFLRWMLPHVTPAERARMVAKIRRNAPPPVFASIMDMLRQRLSAGELDKLNAALAPA